MWQKINKMCGFYNLHKVLAYSGIIIVILSYNLKTLFQSLLYTMYFCRKNLKDVNFYEIKIKIWQVSDSIRFCCL